MKENPEKHGNKLTKEEEIDANLATAMGATALYTPEMQEAIIGMVQNADPVMVAGQMVAGLILQTKEQSDSRGLALSNNIWMADGGVADRLAAEAARMIDATTGIEMEGQEDKIWIEALNVLKMAKGGGQQQNPMGGGDPANPQPEQVNPAMAPSGAPNIMGAVGGMG